MYNEFYNFDRSPFENTPDPRSFYASEQHREALAAIEYCVRMRKGYVLVTGDIGSGKTTVGRTMLERCGGSAKIVGVLHGHDEPMVLLRQILLGLGSRFDPADDHTRLLKRLQNRLQIWALQNRPVVIYIDEAQTLSDGALEELRLLSNLDTDTQKLVQVVLIGQPELRQRIRSPRFAALRQRIALAKELRPLGRADTGLYIAHRIRAVSADPSRAGVVFSPLAIDQIHAFTGGTPRLINFTCDNCLLLGMVREARQVTPEMVRHVMADMVPTFDPSDPELDDLDVEPKLTLAGSI
ncbi:MAG: AAA family ATPase [Planctomycetota bacterium]|nr:AAA family ATPase [Planctomycetota bacterium]